MSPLDLERIDGMPVVHVNADIDAANATATQQQLADALGPDASSLVIDLGATRYIDSAGIDMLMRLGNRLDQRRAELILVIPDTSQLKRLAAIVGLPDAIAIYPTLPAALQAAAEQQTQIRAPHPDTNEATAGRTMPTRSVRLQTESGSDRGTALLDDRSRERP